MSGDTTVTTVTSELVAETGEVVAARHALALFNLNTLIAANVGAALNVGTVNSTAVAEAYQFIEIHQS